jgi:hypothetical protein
MDELPVLIYQSITFCRVIQFPRPDPSHFEYRTCASFGQSIIWNNTSWSSIIQFIILIDHIPVFCLCSPCRAHQLLRFKAYNLFSLIDVVYDCSVLHSGSSVTYLDGPLVLSIRPMSFQSHKYFMFWSSFRVISCLPRRTAAYKLCSVQAY